MSDFAPLEELLGALSRRGWKEIEAYAKRGRTRRLALGVSGPEVSSSLEEGWAVRASQRRRSLAWAATGRPVVSEPFAAGDAPPFRLPDPQPVPPWIPPADLDAPLLGEVEGLALLETIGRELGRELPGARLTAAELVEGAAEAELLSSRGVRARPRHRLASLRLEAALAGGGAVVVERCEREARRFRSQALARRLADRLLVGRDGLPPEPGAGELVLAPAVATRLLAALAPWLCGATAGERLAPLLDSAGRIAAGCLTVTDDGRRPDGPAAAPVDGEGSPAGRVALVEEGHFRQPLVAWWEARPGQVATGCMRRDGFRDLPRRGPTHLAIEPNERLSPADLLAGVDRGHYLLDLEGPPRLDLAADWLAVPVCGFALAAGRPAAPMRGGWLCGPLRALWSGAVAVGRDLDWLPGDGLFGAPTLLLSGLEVRRAPGPS